MNKNRFKAIFLSVAVSLFVISGLFAPLASAAPAPEDTQRYIEIPLTVSRPDPTLTNVNSGCSTMPCRDVSSGVGVYAFVGDHKIESKNIVDLYALDQTLNDGNNNPYNESPLSKPAYAIVNGALRVYDLTLNHSYKIYFTFDDSKSSDIQKLVGQVRTYCQRASLAEPTNVPADEKNAATITYHIAAGCLRYASEPFLPSAIDPYNVSGGRDIAYTTAVLKLPPETIQAAVPTSTSVGTNTEDECTIPPETTGRYLACMFLDWGAATAGKMDSAIQKFLFTPTEQIFTPEMKTAWNTFRIIGVVLILIAGLAMVISQAMGFEIFDAYTVKKVLPRLLVAAIGISLSWPILEFVVTLFNDLGIWAHNIILYPFKGLDNNAIGSVYTAGAVILGGIVVGAAMLGPVGVILLLFTIILSLLTGLLVLAIRQILIIMTVLMAPLAIAAYILPGTQKLWEFWKGAFLTSMYMFPIIMGFIAAGKAMAQVAGSVDNSQEMHMLAVLAYVAPYFLLPFAFKLAGGLMATIFSIANDRNKGAFDRLRKARQGYGAAHRERTYGRRILQERANINSKMQARADRGKTSLTRAAWRGVGRGVAGYNVEAQMSDRRAAVSKELNAQIETGEDDEIRGLAADMQRGVQTRADGSRFYYTVNGNKEISESAVLRGRKRWGNDSFAQQTALSYEMRKANSEEELQNIAKNYPALAQSWGMNAGQATGTWIGAAFENQGQHLEFKNMRIRNGGMAMNQEGYKSFVDEIYEKKGSYQMSQMSSNTIQELKNAYAVGDAQTKERVKAIAETFMSRYGSGGLVPGDDDRPPIQVGAPGGGRAASYQTNTQGAGHVAERVRELAVGVGVYQELPQSSYTESGPPQTPSAKRQN